jgi:hypothetical protein
VLLFPEQENAIMVAGLASEGRFLPGKSSVKRIYAIVAYKAGLL